MVCCPFGEVDVVPRNDQEDPTKYFVAVSLKVLDRDSTVWQTYTQYVTVLQYVTVCV